MWHAHCTGSTNLHESAYFIREVYLLQNCGFAHQNGTYNENLMYFGFFVFLNNLVYEMGKNQLLCLVAAGVCGAVTRLTGQG